MKTIDPLLCYALQRSGKITTASSIIDVLDIQLCLVDVQVIICIGSSIEGLTVGILTFSRCHIPMISLLKGVEKEGREPISDEP